MNKKENPNPHCYVVWCDSRVTSSWGVRRKHGFPPPCRGTALCAQMLLKQSVYLFRTVKDMCVENSCVRGDCLVTLTPPYSQCSCSHPYKLPDCHRGEHSPSRRGSHFVGCCVGGGGTGRRFSPAQAEMAVGGWDGSHHVYSTVQSLAKCPMVIDILQELIRTSI